MTTARQLPLEYADIQTGAEISSCNRYRWRLWRAWAGGPTATFIMLNPSTADANMDDPTIRRCVSFAKREGCGALEVVNLFPWRTTEPSALYSAFEPDGGEPGMSAIAAGLAKAGLIVCAWGAFPLAKARADWLLDAYGHLALKCLGVTKDGSPRHPLYVRKDAPLIDWPAQR